MILYYCPELFLFVSGLTLFNLENRANYQQKFRKSLLAIDIVGLGFFTFPALIL